MDPLVVYVFDKPGGHQALMEQQLDAAGVPRLPVEIPAFTWGNRILVSMQVAEQYPDRVLFFVDSWDTLFLGHKWELDNPCWHDGITFASEKKCWPDSREDEYDQWWDNKLVTRWRFLNSNPMCGQGALIAKALRWGWEQFPLAGHTNDTCDPEGNVCERFYTDLLFRAPKEWGLRIDTQCVLAQTVAEGTVGELAIRGGRIKNLITDTYPIFFHLNGKAYFNVSLLHV